MADNYEMKNGVGYAAEVHHSSASLVDGEKSMNRDDLDMARLGKRQTLRVSTPEMEGRYL